jgi:hypothetical protein
VPVTAPVRSNRPARVAGSGSARGASSTSAIPIGTLTSSTQRQDSQVVIAPPATRPSGLPIDAMAVYAPERPRPRRPLRERRRDQRQGGRGCAGGPDPLQGAADEQLPLVLGQPAEQRGPR